MANPLEVTLAESGGADAPLELSARLRELLAAELERGDRELRASRTGYPEPIVVALAPGDGAVLAALPLPPELRADTDAASDRGAAMAAGVVEKVVEGAGPGHPRDTGELSLELGCVDDSLALSYPARDPEFAVEYAREALDELFDAMDRLRARALVVPAHALAPVDDLRPPIGATHPLRVAEAAVRLGGSSLDDATMEAIEPLLLDLLEPGGAAARAHDDPDPARRVTRRILQRLAGMGKWGGYHTAFDHLARGFAGHERALAYDAGEALVAAGLLVEKLSVGQRHVSLNPRRSGDIRRLIDEGAMPEGLALP